jgi:nicotinamide-nucleotide amidase
MQEIGDQDGPEPGITGSAHAGGQSAHGELGRPVSSHGAPAPEKRAASGRMKPLLAQRAEAVVKEAQARHLTLATVESCTAGSLGLLLADAPGASAVLHGGFIVYTKANKTVAVGVPPALIEAHTAVSREVAEAMARGGIARSPADVAIAITGVAGPEPDEDGNPVGLVHIAAASREGRVSHVEANFGTRSREESRELTLDAALRLVQAMILSQNPQQAPA